MTGKEGHPPTELKKQLENKIWESQDLKKLAHLLVEGLSCAPGRKLKQIFKVENLIYLLFVNKFIRTNQVTRFDILPFRVSVSCFDCFSQYFRNR